MSRAWLMRLGKSWDGLEAGLSIVSGLIIMTLMVLVLVSVVGRALHNPFRGIVEMSQLLMPCCVFLAEPYTQKVGSHVRMELLLNSQRGKVRVAMEMFIYLLVVSLLFYVIWGSSVVAIEALRIHDVIGGQLVSYPTGPSRMTIPVGFSFLVVRILQQIVRTIRESGRQ